MFDVSYAGSCTLSRPGGSILNFGNLLRKLRFLRDKSTHLSNMGASSWAIVAIVALIALCASPSAALYEDEAGKDDWYAYIHIQSFLLSHSLSNAMTPL
jgi:hypothetical protein